MAREIVHIPAKPERERILNGKSNKIRLAAYCRVSSQNEDQLYSFDNQVTYYQNYAKDNPRYTLVDIYADEGISGMNVRNRLEFQRMIQDCKDGKVDLVITKSVTRFARNTQDCLNYARQLKDLGIGVFFEKENINTMDSTGELLFSILASLAQDECRSISENTKWGIRSLYKQGVLHLSTVNFLGYDKDENGKLVINEREAGIVKRVFYEFLEGSSPGDIARKLTAEEIPGVKGSTSWYSSTIYHMLRNEKYMGDALCQKYYVADYLTGKQVLNKGEIEQVYIKKNHEPIVPVHIWKAVQQELDRGVAYRKKHGLYVTNHLSDKNPFAARVFCGKCGQPYTQRTWYRDKKPVKVWQCRSRYAVKGAMGCGNVNLHKEKLLRFFHEAWKEIILTREGRLSDWEKRKQEGTELEAYRAQQMICLTESWPSEQSPDIALVNKVLDHLVYFPDSMVCNFLDGTQITISININS